MKAKKLLLRAGATLAGVALLAAGAAAQNRPVKIAYSAVSAGIGSLWLTHEEGLFRKHGLDSSLIKKVNVSEKKYFQFRAEAFNVLNHPTFGTPNTQVTSTLFGTINTQSNRPRQLQMGIRFIF